MVLMVVQPETPPLTISFLFFVSRVQSAKYIFYVENLLRATQTRVLPTQLQRNFRPPVRPIYDDMPVNDPDLEWGYCTSPDQICHGDINILTFHT